MALRSTALLAPAMLLALASPTAAQTPRPAAPQFGKATCADIESPQALPDVAVSLGYAVGYLSGKSGREIKAARAGSALGDLRKECSEHPTKLIVEAAEEMAKRKAAPKQ